MIDAKKPVKLPTQQILPIVGLIVGIVFLYIGLSEFGFWNSNTHTPTAAFFSTIVSVGLIALSLIALLQSIRKPREEFRLLNWYVPIGFLLMVIAMMIIGTVPAVIIFEIIWCRFYEKMSWKTTIIAVVFCLIMVIPIFTWWLGIDFPVGKIGELILGY